MNGDYVLEESEIDWKNFFLTSEYLDTIQDNLDVVKENINNLKSVQNSEEEPFINPGKSFCSGCEFWDYCTKDKPKDWIINIPRLHKTKKKI